MKKYTLVIVAATFILLILSATSYLVFNDKSLQLTEQEKDFIAQNKDNLFLVGYFPTDAEKRFSDKLCEKIEADTGLKLRVYSDTWNNTLTLLKMGSLPIVMNMNITPNRSEYAFFTESFIPISCGIYSSETYVIDSFESMKGKTIGVEHQNALSETFQSEYPNLDYKLNKYDSFEETRAAFKRGDIDGFLSSKSYDDNVLGLNYFEIEGITKGTNHIGVSKEYPLLYSILDKEISLLIDEKWDVLLSEIITFELERTLLEFDQLESNYLSHNPSLKVGIPTEYFLYASNDDFLPHGVLPSIVEKIAFICEIDIQFVSDSLKNLRIREDIDFYVDNLESKKVNTAFIFDTDVIVVGTAEKKVISEKYELSPYKVGIVGIPNMADQLIVAMPNLDITVYQDIEHAQEQLADQEIDYLILPKHYFYATKYSDALLERGELTTKQNYFVSNNANLASLLNKSLTIIDSSWIIQDELKSAESQISKYFYLVLVLLLILLLFVIRFILKRFYNYHFKDKNFNLYNSQYLKRKIRAAEGYLALIEITNADNIRSYYGKKLYDKYLANLINNILKDQPPTERLIYLEQNKFLYLFNDIKDINFLYQNHNKSMFMTSVTIEYGLSVCFVDFGANDSLETITNKLNMGMTLARENKTPFYFDDKQQNIQMNHMIREEKIKEALQGGLTKIKYLKIIDKDEEIFGELIIPSIEGISHHVLKKTAKKLNLETHLDTESIKLNFSTNKVTEKPLFFRVSENTILTDGFFKWLKLIAGISPLIYLLIDFQTYENNYDKFASEPQLQIAIDNFGLQLDKDLSVRYYANVQYLILSRGFTQDLYENDELLEFLTTFSHKYQKKIITNTMPLKNTFAYIKEDLH